MNKNLLIWAGIIIMFLAYTGAAVYVGWKLHTVNATTKTEVTGNVTAQNQPVNVLISDTQKVKPSYVPRPAGKDTGTVARDTTTRQPVTYTNTATKSGTATDSLRYKGKGYPVKYEAEIQNQVTIAPDGIATFVNSLALKLNLPVIQDSTSATTTQLVPVNHYIPTPFFLQTSFWVALAEAVLIFFMVLKL
jgi:hypothetical protein